MNNIGTRLKLAIKNSKYNQKEIASIIKTTEKSLSSYTQNKVSIPIEVLINICELINVSLNEIVYGIDNNDKNEIFFSKFRKLNENDKIDVIKYIEFLENKNNQISSTLINTEKENNYKIDSG